MGDAESREQDRQDTIRDDILDRNEEHHVSEEKRQWIVVLETMPNEPHQGTGALIWGPYESKDDARRFSEHDTTGQAYVVEQVTYPKPKSPPRPTRMTRPTSDGRPREDERY